MAQGKVEICGVNTAKLPLLKAEEKEKLFAQIESGDQEARQKYIEGNLRLVLSVIKRFSSSNENVDDLFQIGCIGLIKAIDNFDSTLNVKFSTYAVPMIIGEIRRFLRDNNTIRVSRSLKELAIRAARLREQILMERGVEPGIEELAACLCVEPEELVQAMDGSAEVESLQKIVYQGDGEGLSLMDKVEQDKDEEEVLLRQLLLEQLLGTLGPKERRLIVLRFFHDRTQTQVAQELGMSQVQVSRLERRGLKRLRESFGP